MAEVDLQQMFTQTDREHIKEEPELMQQEEELHIITVKTEDDEDTKDEREEEVKEEDDKDEEEPSDLHQTPTEEKGAETDVSVCDSEEHSDLSDDGQGSADSSVSDQGPFSCSECGRSFKWESHLLTHMPVHTGETPEVCTPCRKRFKNRADYEKHMLSHKNKSSVGKTKIILNQLICSVCDKSFAQKINLIRHRRNLHHICPFCPNQYESMASVTRHMKSHNKDGLIGRSVNEKSLVLEPHLRRHRPIYKGVRAEVCKVCKKWFGSKEDLKEHVLIHKEKKKPKPHKCGACKERFETKGELNQHVSSRHKPEKHHKCPHCPRRFEKISQLKSHQASHRLWLSCAECKKKFEKAAELVRHMEMHAEKPFTCSVCQKGFSQKKYLINHRLKKHNVCPHCPKQFSSTKGLTVHRKKVHGSVDASAQQTSSCSESGGRVMLEPHLRTHEAPDPQVCEVCNQKFSYKSDFVIHMLTHGEKPHRCLGCKTKFRTKTDLEIHMLTYIEDVFQSTSDSEATSSSENDDSVPFL